MVGVARLVGSWVVRFFKGPFAKFLMIAFLALWLLRTLVAKDQSCHDPGC